MDKILLVIPARGGSKGVPRKNIYPVAGKPLIAHVIETALKAKDCFYKIIVSTDDEEIADISRQYGAEVPFLRPDELAADTAASLPVIQHAARYIEKLDNVRLDWTMLVPPTSPMVSSEDLRTAVTMATSHPPAPSSLVSIVEEVEGHPLKIKVLEDGYLKPFLPNAPETIRRQDLEPKVYRRNCCIYMTRRDVLLEKDDLYGSEILAYEMPAERSIDVNSHFDLKLVEHLLNETAHNL